MNERIRELAKEAAVVYQKTLPPATHTTPLYLIDKLGKDAKDAGIEIISDGFCEKFAQLIIDECIAQIGEYTGEQKVEKIMLDDGTRGIKYNIVSAEEVLKEHFGLK